MIFLLGFYQCVLSAEQIIHDIHIYNKDYNWPQKQDFLSIFWILPSMILSKYLIERISGTFTDHLVSKKHKLIDMSLTDEGKLYSRKIRTHIFKTLWNLFNTILGYYILNQCKYFPKELLGDGEINTIFEDKYPNLYFHFRPRFMDTFYLMNLCYYIMDLLYLLVMTDQQSDFFLMVVHHLSSIFLIFFSYWANLSNIGSIIFHLHNIGNVLVYFVRTTMYSDISKIFKGLTTVILITVWIYSRWFVLGKLLILVWTDLPNWNWIILYMWLLTCMLLIMHVHWVVEILKKLKMLMLENKAEDVSRVKLY